MAPFFFVFLSASKQGFCFSDTNELRGIKTLPTSSRAPVIRERVRAIREERESERQRAKQTDRERERERGGGGGGGPEVGGGGEGEEER
jgi:hypothetical protein